MKPSGLARMIVAAAILAVVLYVGGFAFDQHLRTRHGPWRVAFVAGPATEPRLIINQTALRITNLTVILSGEVVTNTVNQTVVFDAPQRSVAFGRVKFEDLTYLPGVVTFDLFGHEIELLPRTLYVNRRPRAWTSNTTITLSARDKPESLPEPRRRRPP
jgi:hypothetical protein